MLVVSDNFMTVDLYPKGIVQPIFKWEFVEILYQINVLPVKESSFNNLGLNKCLFQTRHMCRLLIQRGPRPT